MISNGILQDGCEELHVSGSESAGDVSCGSWLRENVLTQAPTVHYPVNAVRHG